MNLANCPSCGKLFARHIREVCNECFAKGEKQYESCLDYLKKNKGTTINELSEATGVSIKQITKYIREGRISLKNAVNMHYPCEMCGAPIREGGMCASCHSRLQAEIRSATSARKQGEGVDSTGSENTYRIKDRFNERN